MQEDLILPFLTNNARLLNEASGGVASLDVKEIPFNAVIPSGVRFYSAHFKIDAFRYISKQNFQYAVLCDLDMVCLQSAPPAFLKAQKNQTPLVYEISDQVISAYGHDAIIKDMEAVTYEISEGRWIGGEFIAGPSSFFKILADEIDTLLPRYFSKIGEMHHVGDEAYTSCAIQKIRKSGVFVGDAGLVGLVGRYWNAEVRHYQKPWLYFKSCFLLHLPADKRFLAELGASSFSFGNPKSFAELYEKYVRDRKIKNLMSSFFRLIKRKLFA